MQIFAPSSFALVVTGTTGSTAGGSSGAVVLSTNGSGSAGTTGVAVAMVFSGALMLAVSKGEALTMGLNFKPCLGGDALSGGTIGTATGIGMGVPPGVVWGVADRSTSTMSSSSSGGANSGSGMLWNLVGGGGNSSETMEAGSERHTLPESNMLHLKIGRAPKGISSFNHPFSGASC